MEDSEKFKNAMDRISQGEDRQFRYIYGKFYDPNLERLPRDGKYDLIVYTYPGNQERAIGSLEGIFETRENLGLKICNPIVQRDEMEAFQEKYQGRFIKFI